MLLLGEEVVGVGRVDLSADGGGAVGDAGVVGVLARVEFDRIGLSSTIWELFVAV